MYQNEKNANEYGKTEFGISDELEKISSERQNLILKVIVEEYSKTGAPVGSRTISRTFSDKDMASSPATIRNDMSDLEELGLIMQPHTSAGRMPTDLGYRYYIKYLMPKSNAESSSEKKQFSDYFKETDNSEERYLHDPEAVLRRFVDILAHETHSVVMFSAPQYKENVIKLVELLYIDSRHIAAIVVTEGNVVRNRVIEPKEPISRIDIDNLNRLLNAAFQGKTLDAITLRAIDLSHQFSEYGDIIVGVLDAVKELLSEGSERTTEIHTTNPNAFLNSLDDSEVSLTKEILSLLDKKAKLFDFFDENESRDEIHAYIGMEKMMDDLMSGSHNCSLITTPYELGNVIRGRIGIIGPKRMDYQNVYGLLNSMLQELSHWDKEDLF